MVDVEDCLEAINKLQRNLHSTIIEKMTEEDLTAMARDWQYQFKYWDPGVFNKVINHIIQNNKYFPRTSTFFAIKNEIIKEEVITPTNCEKCKNDGVRVLKEIHNGIEYEFVAACDCGWGQKVKKTIPNIAFYNDIVQAPQSEGDELPF